jgi:hypothetical protein
MMIGGVGEPTVGRGGCRWGARVAEMQMVMVDVIGVLCRSCFLVLPPWKSAVVVAVVGDI